MTQPKSLIEEMETDCGTVKPHPDVAPKRRRSMLWLELGKDKDPEFGQKLFLTDGKVFEAGKLESIKQTPDGKSYSFTIGSDGDTYTWPKYYCEPVNP